MTIKCLFAQRIERYPGQFAPELLAAIDEYGNEDNPDYLTDEETKAKNSKDFTIIKRISVSVSDEDFQKVFCPEEKPIQGTIV